VLPQAGQGVGFAAFEGNGEGALCLLAFLIVVAALPLVECIRRRQAAALLQSLPVGGLCCCLFRAGVDGAVAVSYTHLERRAAEAERELMEWKKVRFMQDRVGEEFAALVLNPAKFGLFVELTDLFVEGLVPIDSLRDDRYTWRENTHEIIGERTGRRFRAGDRVQVVLDRILAQERRLQFSIVEEGLALTGRKAAKTPPKPKKSKRKDTTAPASKGKKRFGRKAKRR